MLGVTSARVQSEKKKPKVGIFWWRILQPQISRSESMKSTRMTLLSKCCRARGELSAPKFQLMTDLSLPGCLYAFRLFNVAGQKAVPGEKCGMLVSEDTVLRHAAESSKNGVVHRRGLVETALSLSGLVLQVTPFAVFTALSSTISCCSSCSFSSSSPF